ncbi:hypothetical protein RI367_008084 [Sorochytrium milnesiophthora]
MTQPASASGAVDPAYCTLLQQTLSADQRTRSNAEQTLDQLKRSTSTTGFGTELCRIVLHNEVDIALRQIRSLATVTAPPAETDALCTQLLSSSRVICCAQTKAFLQNELMTRGLSDPDARIRVISAYVVALIARLAINEWPTFFDQLLAHLRQGALPGVHGALRVLTEFVREDLTEQQLQQFGGVLLTDLLKIVQSDAVTTFFSLQRRRLWLTALHQYTISVRCKPLIIMKDLVTMLYNIKETAPDIEQQLKAGLGGWLAVIGSILQTPINIHADDEAVLQLLHAKTCVLKLVEVLLVGFPRLLDGHISPILENAWRDLGDLLVPYTNACVSEADGGGELVTGADSDGENIGVATYLYAMLDVFGRLVVDHKYAPLIVGAQAAAKELEQAQKFTKKKVISKNRFAALPLAQQGGLLGQLVSLLISYMQMTADQMELWTQDPNQYVLDEMEQDTFSQSMRIICLDLVLNAVQEFEEVAVVTVVRCATQAIEQSVRLKSQGVASWWKLQDAALLCLGRISQEALLSIEGGQTQFDLAGLFDHVILEAIKDNAHSFLQGRALWFAGQYVSALPLPLASQYVALSIQALNDSRSVPVRISALRALKSFADELGQAEIANAQSSMLEAVGSLAPHVTNAALTLVLETLGSIIKIDEQVTLRYADSIIPLLLRIWSDNSSDQHVSGLTTDLLEALAGMPSLYPIVSERCLPVIESCIASYAQADNAHIVAGAVEALCNLVKHASAPLPRPLVDKMFPMLMHLLLTADESAILQNGQECLKYYAAVDLPSLLEWTSQATGQSGMDLVLRAISRILDPQQDEAAGFFVGDLITKVILKAGTALTPVLPDLLSTVLRRLKTAKAPTFVQTLLLVFAQLARSQPETMVQFLATLQVDSQSALETLLQIWVENHETIHGSYDLKVSAFALTKLYQLQDPRVQNVLVKGEPIIDAASDRIVTRSHAKQTPQRFSSVPFHAKVIKLLYAELVQSADGAMPDDDGDDGSSLTDEDYEDDTLESFQYGTNALALQSDYAKVLDMLEGDEDLDDGETGDHDAEMDPDKRADPLLHQSMREFLVPFFRQYAAQDVVGLQQLTEAQQKLLHRLLE